MLLRLAPAQFAAAELLQFRGVHRRLVEPRAHVALEGAHARIGLRRGTRPPPLLHRPLLHPSAALRRLVLLRFPVALGLFGHGLLDPHCAQDHGGQIQARLSKVLVDHVAGHVVLAQRVVDQRLGHALRRQQRQRAVAARRVRVVVLAQSVGGQQFREAQLCVVVVLLVELAQHPRRLRLRHLALRVDAVLARTLHLTRRDALPTAALVHVLQERFLVRGLDVRARGGPHLLPTPRPRRLLRGLRGEEALAPHRHIVLAVVAAQALWLAEVGPEGCGVLDVEMVVVFVGRGADGRGEVHEHQRGKVGRGRCPIWRRRGRRLGLKDEKLRLLLERLLLLLVEAPAGRARALVGAQAANLEDAAVVLLVKAAQK